MGKIWDWARIYLPLPSYYKPKGLYTNDSSIYFIGVNKMEYKTIGPTTKKQLSETKHYVFDNHNCNRILEHIFELEVLYLSNQMYRKRI